MGGGVGGVTGYAIPRFVSTKGKSNVRTGPGTKYPIQFTLQVPVPLQIIEEYENWRKITDWQGEQGWIHGALLTGEKQGIVTTPKTPIYKKQTPHSPIIATAEKNYVFAISECTAKWCKIHIQSPIIKGYVRTQDIWGNP